MTQTGESSTPPAGASPVRMENARFRNPHSLKNKLGRVLWHIVWIALFRPTPRQFGGWRRFLLTLFGAKLGKTWLHQSVRVWAPWMLTSGDDVFIDRDVNLYNAYGIEIGDRVVISFESTLCTASHDHEVADFPLIGAPVRIGSDVWIAASAFVAPGITIGQGAVVAAAAVVVKDVPEWTVVGGNPAKYIKKRIIRPASPA